MSRKTNLSLAVIGTTFAVSLAASPLANAADNPFSMTEPAGGQTVAAGDHEGEGSCGEGKCGEGGEGKDKGEKGEEGKCGEGKCGG